MQKIDDKTIDTNTIKKFLDTCLPLEYYTFLDLTILYIREKQGIDESELLKNKVKITDKVIENYLDSFQQAYKWYVLE